MKIGWNFQRVVLNLCQSLWTGKLQKCYSAQLKFFHRDYLVIYLLTDLKAIKTISLPSMVSMVGLGSFGSKSFLWLRGCSDMMHKAEIMGAQWESESPSSRERAQHFLILLPGPLTVVSPSGLVGLSSQQDGLSLFHGILRCHRKWKYQFL